MARYLARFDEGWPSLEPTPCLCDRKNGECLALSDRYGFPCTWRLCDDCGVIRLDPRPDKCSLEEFYAVHYRDIYVPHGSMDSFFSDQVSVGRDIYMWLHSFGMAPRGGGRVLEVGCGAGGLLAPFRDMGNSVIGCDYDLRYLDYGRSRGLDLLEGGLESLHGLPRFDLIIVNHVLEHVPDPLEFLVLAASHLKDSGRIYISMPGVFSIGHTYGNLGHYLQGAHLYNFNLDNLRFHLSKAGLALVEGDDLIRSVWKLGRGSDCAFPEKAGEKVRKYLDALQTGNGLPSWSYPGNIFVEKVRHRLRLMGRGVISPSRWWYQRG